MKIWSQVSNLSVIRTRCHRTMFFHSLKLNSLAQLAAFHCSKWISKTSSLKELFHHQSARPSRKPRQQTRSLRTMVLRILSQRVINSRLPPWTKMNSKENRGKCRPSKITFSSWTSRETNSRTSLIRYLRTQRPSYRSVARKTWRGSSGYSIRISPP